MSDIGKPERATQNRVVKLFCDELGYSYLGDWADRAGNSNIEEGLLTDYLTGAGYQSAQISTALYKLRTEANHPDRSLYGNNQAVYQLLRYGVPVKTEAGKVTETVHLINWKAPASNHFAIAEEVTLKGKLQRRPDVVLYINGIAIGVLELKNSRVTIGDGIRQSLSNQLPEFNAWFFSTVQLVMAGNDSEGMQYGTIGTPEKFFLTWKEDEADNSRHKLDKYLLKMCSKARLIELMHDFVLFDGGVKKLPRVHQYFGIKAAQEHVHQHQGGIIWHTQGAGKSILMVLLAKWILENKPQARVVIITDRDELDKQIERVFTDVVALLRAYANVADEMAAAGYSEQDAKSIKTKLDQYLAIREIIRKASGETLDLKPFEADMRHLIDTYIEASEPRKISPFDGIGLLDLIVKTGIADAIANKLADMQGNQQAIAETIENNVRSKIIKDSLTDPAYFEKMSALLNEIIKLRKERAIEYEEYLKRIADIATKVQTGPADPTSGKLDSPGKRAIFNNLQNSPVLHAVKAAEADAPYGPADSNEDPAVALALKIDKAVRLARPDGWRGVQVKELVIKRALYDTLKDVDEVERLFLVINAQLEY